MVQASFSILAIKYSFFDRLFTSLGSKFLLIERSFGVRLKASKLLDVAPFGMNKNFIVKIIGIPSPTNKSHFAATVKWDYLRL